MKLALGFLTLALSLSSINPSDGADYRLSETFNLEISVPSAPQRYLHLGDGRAIAIGNFDQLDGETYGSFVLLKSDGSFEPFTADTPLLGATPNQAVLNSDGSISLLFDEHGLAEFADSSILLTYSSTNQLTRTLGIPYGLNLLPDDTFAIFENQVDGSTSTPVWTAKVTRLILDNSNTLIADPSFTSTEIPGEAEGLFPLPSGGILLSGLFPHGETQATSRLIKLTATGAIDPSFSRTGITNATPGFDSFTPKILSNGEILLAQTAGVSPKLKRLQPDGTLDTSFNQSPNLGFYLATTSISPAPDNKYYLTGPFIDIGENHVTAARLNPDGSLDDTFQFDRNHNFSEVIGDHSAFPLPDGTVFASGRTDPDNYQTIGFAILSTDGTATPSNPGSLARISSPSASWLPSGELLIDDGAANIDGSRRKNFPISSTSGLLPLPYGGFVNVSFEVFDENGVLTSTLEVPRYSSLMAVLPDNTLLARVRKTTGSGFSIKKLKLNGSFDSDFPDLPDYNNIITATDEHFYFAAFDEALGKNTLQRRRLDGTLDPDFSIDNQYLLSSEITITDQAIYVPYIHPLGQSPQQEFGARYFLDGTEDTNYAPHLSIRRTSPSELPTKRNFAADGSSFHFALAQGQDEQYGYANLWYVSPEGETSLIDGNLRWTDARIVSSPSGDLLVSGTLKTASGEIQQTALYTRSPLGFSTAFLSKTSYANEPVSLNVAVLDGAGASYTWFKDGNPIANSNSPSLDFDSLTANDAGDYTLNATLDGETYSFGPIKLVPPSHPIFVDSPKPVAAPLESDVELSAFAEGLPYPKFQWFRDNIAITGATSPTLKIDALDLPDLGTYQLRAQNPIGTNWSQPATLSLAGISVVDQLQLDVRLTAAQPIFDMYPREGGGYIYNYRDPQHPSSNDFLYSEYKPDGTQVDDLASTLDLGNYDDIKICPFSGQIFVYRSEYQNSGQELKTTFARLLPDHSIDSSFGEHTIIGDSYPGVAFRQWPDGTVWAEAYDTALSISPEGVETELKRDRNHTRFYDSNFISRFSLKLDDGTFTLTNLDETLVYRIKADGVLIDEPNFAATNRYDDDFKLVGIWPNGNLLYYDEAGEKLSCLDWSNNEIWTVQIGNKRMRFSTGYPRLASATPNLDNSEIHFILYEDDTFSSGQIVQIKQDGTHNMDTSPIFDIKATPQAFKQLYSGEYIIAGEETTSNGAGTPLNVIQIVKSDTGESTQTPHVTLINRSIKQFSNTAPDGSFFALLDGTIINGVSTGYVAKFDSTRNLVASFKPDISWTQYGKPVNLLALPDGGVAIITKNNSQYHGHIVQSDGQSKASFELIGDKLNGAPTTFPQVHLQNDTHLVFVLSTLQKTQLIRYNLAGVKDATFTPEIFSEQASCFDSAIGPQGRIYLVLHQVFTTSNIIIRYLADGSSDNSFSRPTSVDDITQITIDAEGLPYVAGAKVYKLTESGSIDPSFTPPTLPYSTLDFFDILEDGSLLVDSLIYNSDGSLKEGIPGLTTQNSHFLVGNAIASIPNMYEPSSVEVSFRTLSGYPTILQQPRSQAAKLGSKHNIQIVTDYPSEVTYQWFKDGDPITGATSGVLAFNSLQQSDFGNYSVRIDWPDGHLELQEFTLSEDSESNSNTTAPKLSYTLDGSALHLEWPNVPQPSFTLMQTTDYRTWSPVTYPTINDDDINKVVIPLDTSVLPVFLELVPGE